MTETATISGLKIALSHGKCTPLPKLLSNLERDERQLQRVIAMFTGLASVDPARQERAHERAMDACQRLRNTIKSDLDKCHGTFIHHRQVKMMNSDPLFVHLYGTMEDPMEEFKDDLMELSKCILRLREILDILNLTNKG